MALRFIDGFDHYATAELLDKWNTGSFGASSGAQSSIVRTGTQALLLHANNYFLTKFLDSQQTWIIGFGFYATNFSVSGDIVRIIDASEGTTQVSFRVNTGGQIAAYRGNTTLIGTSDIGIIKVQTWQYIELKIKIDNSTGTIDIRVDGTNVLSLTNQDTQLSVNATADSFSLVSENFWNHYFDDFYACDDTGSENNDFLGVCKVDTLYPDGNGNSSQLVGQDANSVDNYLNVDELLTDSDTTYNESSVVTERDDYTFDAMNITPITIFGVASNAHAKKSDSGTRSLDLYTRVGGTNYDAAIDKVLAEGYQTYQAIWDLNPADSLAWEVADVDGAGFGIEVAS